MLLPRRKPINIKEILLEVDQLGVDEAPDATRPGRRRDRRSGVDRRRAPGQAPDLPEGFKDRRSHRERRSGYDRRGFIDL
ncbi:MAG: hypothetical protein C4576_04750 [Desulfobacteraceae bacterium]|nr:MAG: hypothetical protein C4576_04750 [Desulfobacteraceae bacterium]